MNSKLIVIVSQINRYPEEIQALSDGIISSERYSLNSQEQLAVDDGSVLIITDRSIKKLEQLWGKRSNSGNNSSW